MPPSLSLNNGSRRLLKDKLAKFTIVSGGVLVLIALLLIFLYLLSVVLPVFKEAEVELQQQVATLDGPAFSLGIDERQEVGFALQQNATLAFFPLRDLQQGLSLQTKWPINNSGTKVTGFASSIPKRQTYAYVFDQSHFVLVKPEVQTSFVQQQRQLQSYLHFPLGQQPLELLGAGKQLQSLFFEGEDGRYLLAGIDQNKQLTLKQATLKPGEQRVEWQTLTLPIGPKHPEQVLFSSDMQQLFVREKNQLWIYQVSQSNEITLKTQVDLSPDSGVVTDVTLLAGSNSLLVSYREQKIKLWFEVPGELGRHYKTIREFATEQTIAAIYPEFFRKGFFARSEQGQFALYFANRQQALWQHEQAMGRDTMLGVAPHGNGLLLAQGAQVFWYKVQNEHPDVSWQALWNKVWYESYPEEDYVWQSTAATDDYEAKFSLVPLTFGTLKAALYAMLFSVPLAICAAVYSAYFMSARMRNWVKPGIEIIEALPTVILGFMAGLWLAPIVEERLFGLLLFTLCLPLVIFLLAFAWRGVSQKLKDRFLPGWYGILLIPVVVVCMLLCLQLGPWLENLFFEHSLVFYLSQEWGIDYDQRNAIVIGIAMGFAVTPTIFSIAEDAIGSVPKHLTDGSLALGATQWQTVIHVVLLTASPGIFAAVMMGLGRAVGETMIVLMATGNTPITEWNIFEGMRTLAANIAIEMPESEVSSSHYRILFLTAFVLFIFTFIFNSAAEFVRQNLREKYSRM